MIVLHLPLRGGLIAALIASAVNPAATAQDSAFGGYVRQPLDGPAHNCITPREHDHVRDLLAAYEAAHGPLSAPEPASSSLLYPFWPQAGYVYGDLFSGLFVDQDPSSGFRDYSCRDFTYNTHAGIDCGLRSFAEQMIGVPVFAVLEGTVVATQDGFDDMNVSGKNNNANFVIIDHGKGRLGYYWHLKKNSVIVTPGQPVVAGQQIGLTASSGYSFGPHLHFESRDLPDYTVFDPFAGDCRPGDSGWADQEPLNLNTYFVDFAFTYEDLFQHDPLPYEQPRTGQIATSDGFIFFWMIFANLPPDSTWRNVFIRPDGTTAYDSGDVEFGWDYFIRHSGLFFYWWIPDMHTITGRWRVQVYFNGALMTDAPIEVVAERDPQFNRPPEPISLRFDPPAPTEADAIFCRIDTDLVLDDLDYDVVRYEYTWQIDGNEVRRVTSAGHADAIPRGLAPAGSVVECLVTPSDGRTTGTPATISAVVGDAGSNCSGEEKLKARCREKRGAFLLKAKISGGVPGAVLTFRLDDRPESDNVQNVNNRGKAAAKFSGLMAGEHAVEVLECGLRKNVTCK
ncbi:MAG: M23 family metallopeptidase [Phycisphaerae bacterium]|nr:MAG: M23 family metallopeptidase [Planctomycetota bacterium]KAB2949429.1 MAG: M23 family metallopeptidase [Phycisphaerae bacterium]MBE7458375.1 M23 family metallopeptidase [Planctomycetia bacterium]MCK6465189.1 M23 family metallopeptidase [Phycisphaerae bacterium]MCL4718816.1 M23 family metallopeptidase [Phycisphaerae bacterium]